MLTWINEKAKWIIVIFAAGIVVASWQWTVCRRLRKAILSVS